ncbi:hypothetical protein [Jonesia quinghaiensis]|uniref:hypothetical protein n=1 Tax=Jonesia quinghaiensis TaxID=262806 RepID=UPI0006859E63|nr:hypothetical protein [Jonesia quinghaiensis]
MTVARKAMYICSNPDCLRVTGYVTTKGKPRAIAQAAHIAAARGSGPRGKDLVRMPDGSPVSRGDEANALWLCMPCHGRIDADEEAFPTELLVAWKRDHEERVSGLVGLDLEQSLLRLAEVRLSHDHARDLLQWLDGHRFMYFEDSREFPDQVWKAVLELRWKISNLRGRVTDSESQFGVVLAAIDDAVHEFVVALSDIRVNEITVVSGYPEFERFSEALRILRIRILEVAAPLAHQEGFRFKRIPENAMPKSDGNAAEFRFQSTSGNKK